MEEPDLSRKSHNYFLPRNQEIAQQGREQEAIDSIHNVLRFLTLYNLLINYYITYISPKINSRIDM